MMEQLNSRESEKIISRTVIIGLTTIGRSMAGRRGNKKRYQYFTDSSGTIGISERFKTFRMQSCWSYYTGQSDSSQHLLPVHLSCRMCNQFTFHHQFGIDTWRSQNLKNRRTLFLPVDCTASCTIHAQSMEERHQNAVFLVDINLAMKKGLKFPQTRSNAIILHETFPAYCIPKVVRMETGEIIYDKVDASPRPPPKISLKHDWKREFGTCSTTRRTSCATSTSSQ